jgi:hypothetical protein
MNKTIWKFKLADSLYNLDDVIEIRAPQRANVISVGIQHGKYVVWAEVYPRRPLTTTKIFVRGTGHPFSGEENRFLGTLQALDGSLVFHFYTSK